MISISFLSLEISSAMSFSLVLIHFVLMLTGGVDKEHTEEITQGPACERGPACMGGPMDSDSAISFVEENRVWIIHRFICLECSECSCIVYDDHDIFQKIDADQRANLLPSIKL